jgi:hypothetical protein
MCFHQRRPLADKESFQLTGGFEKLPSLEMWPQIQYVHRKAQIADLIANRAVSKQGDHAVLVRIPGHGLP